MSANIENLTALIERKNWSIKPAKLAKAIEEHPWPRTPKQQNDFREAAKVAWREHRENGGKAHDAKYPALLWSFDAWKAPVSQGGGGSLVSKRSGGSGPGKSATGNTRFTDAKQLQAMVLEVAKEVREGDRVALSRVVRTIRRERRYAITRSKARAALNDLIASGKLKVDPIPAPGTKSATGNTRFTDAKQLKAVVLEVAKEVQEGGDKVALSRVVRTIRHERRMAITRSKARAALNDLIASGKLKADPIPTPGTRTAKPKATNGAATKLAAKKAPAKKAPAKKATTTSRAAKAA